MKILGWLMCLVVCPTSEGSPNSSGVLFGGTTRLGHVGSWTMWSLFWHTLCPIALVGCVTLAVPTARAAITITNHYTRAVSEIGDGGFSANAYSGTTIYDASHPIAVDAVLDSNSYSKNRVDFWSDGSGTVLEYTMEHKRDGSMGSFSWSYESNVFFTAAADESYELSGYYYATDPVGSSGKVNKVVRLHDLTRPSTILFWETSESRNTENERFVLGDANDGDYLNGTLGSLTGNLTAGHNYRLDFNYYISALERPDGGASAVGNLRLVIGNPIIVPEATTLHLMLGGIGLMVCCGRHV